MRELSFVNAVSELIPWVTFNSHSNDYSLHLSHFIYKTVTNRYYFRRFFGDFKFLWRSFQVVYGQNRNQDD